ncbi:transcription elongation factor NusA [Palaeococcus pacificus DY20341]|uniref:Transcription elongation factor NusA n=1 Tax=Palaeococcus pacificus DY20341 TaxID=1343739 RepID=A0A075LV61_9EURY|nr:KH domain-containing protein [Palaeococcus pacificus]AIF70204.1 transcription elongation factor NusA [Palaeococcus pacificus DY20341]
MKAPICEVCLKTDDILCPGDEKKLQDGVISELDVKVARFLYKLLGDADVEFKKAVEAGDLIVIIVGEGQVALVIGKGGKNVKLLMRELGKRVRIIEDTKDVKKLATDLLIPARLFGVNIVYKPDGGQYYKILVPRTDKQRLPASPEVLEKIISQIIGKEAKIALA